MTVKTRFAPSPTGYLHIGGARTALYSWLFAKSQGGEFYLRVEDTDRERSTDDSIQAILDGMNWLGLDYIGEPVYQMNRLDRYREITDQLLEQKLAYRCYCSKERLEALRKQQLEAKQKPRYDGCCRDQESKDLTLPFVVRFKNPREGAVNFTDKVYGEITVQNSELDDLILVRSDGIPTYNLSVVIDDWDMGITHVVRGDDHINNTPRQINILKALNAPIPEYAHLPMILGSDGKRLSKRHGAVSVMQYRDQGYLSEALLNYLVRLGWSQGDQEIFSLQEMIKLFDFEQVHKGAATFNPEKLQWLNQQYLKDQAVENIERQLQWHLQQQKCDTSNGPELNRVIDVLRERTKTLEDMAEKLVYFYQDFDSFDEKAAAKNLKPEAKPILQDFKQVLEGLSHWQADPIHQAVHATAEKHDVKLGKVAQPIRVAVTGNTFSPSIDVTLELIGRERVLKRLQRAIDFID